MENYLKFLILGVCTILAINSASGDTNWSNDKAELLEKFVDFSRRLRALEKTQKDEKENFQQKINELESFQKGITDQHTNEIEEFKRVIARKEEIIDELKQNGTNNNQEINSLKIQVANMAIQVVNLKNKTVVNNAKTTRNAANILINKKEIDINTANISSNLLEIKSNEATIVNSSIAISANHDEMEKQTKEITNNQLNIEKNEAKINSFSVNCTWSDWSDCSVTCGPGFKSRMVTEKAMFGGKPCEGLNQTTCNLQDCPPVPGHNPHPVESRILVAAGYDGSSQYYSQDNQGNLDYSQVVDVGSTSSCSSLQPYPLKIHAATGGVLHGSPVICGGYGKASGESSDDIQSLCYQYDTSSHAWKFLTNMNKKRYYHSTVMINGALWVTGGYGGSNLASTEYIFINGSIINGPNLPAPRNAHCMVTLTDGKVIVLGGNPYYSNNKNVLIFNPETNTFATGPSLIYDRIYSGCAHFLSPLHENRPVVLAVGGNAQNTAEVLDYTITNAWEEIGSLPTTHNLGNSTFNGAKALPSLSGNGAYLQFKQHFYELTCSSTACNWSIMKQKLAHSGRHAVMMYLPSEYTC